MSDLAGIFEKYKRWYQANLDPADEEEKADFIKWGWYEPFALKPIDKPDKSFPASYRTLLRELGTGKLLVASDDEPHEHVLVHPKKFAAERKAALSWISKEGKELTQKKQKLDVQKLLPFLKVDDTTWVFLAAQTRDDDRVFLFDHGFEGGYDKLFCPVGKTLAAFFTSYFKRSRNGDPLNAFNCWDRP